MSTIVRSAGSVRRCRISLLVLLALLACVTATPAANAAVQCTATWTGTAGDGSWATAGNWSPAAVPGSSDAVCLPAGASVSVATGAQTAAVLQGASASLTISGGTLTVGDAASPSSIGTLTLSGGTLAGGAELEISTSLSWTGGTMSGTGSTVVAAGATASLSAGNSLVTLDSRTFSNAGTTTLATGTLRGMNGATVRNSGTLRLNSEASNYGPTLYNAGGTTPKLINTTTGTIQKTAGTGSTQSGFAVESQGAIDISSGQLDFTTGSLVLQGGSQVSGKMVLSGAAVTAGNVQGQNATVQLQSGTLTAGTGTTPTIGTLNFSSGTLNGEGQLNVSNALSWTGGTMSGTGSTVVAAGATASLSAGNSLVTLDGRTFSNAGTTTLATGTLRGMNGATVRNSGTLRLNSEASNYGPTLYNAGGTTPKLINSLGGVVKKTLGAGTTGVGFAVDSDGLTEVQSGELSFSAGGGPSAAGSWSAPGVGASLRFASGSFALGAGAQLSGSMIVSGGSVTAPSVSGTTAALTVSGGTLTLTDGTSPSSVSSLTMSSGTIGGGGELRVSNAVSWTGGTMSGTGSTVVAAGATASLSAGNSLVTLDSRTFSNAGTTTLATGTLRGMNGATVRNSGTLQLNSEASNYGPTLYNAGGTTPKLINTTTGTIQKTAGTGGTRSSFAVESQGAIEVTSGQLDFTSGSLLLHGGSQVSGKVALSGAPVTAGSVMAQNATVLLQGSTLTAGTGTTPTIGTLTFSSGTLNGAGELDVSGSLSWTGGAMAGTGSTVVLAGATASLNAGSGLVTVDGRTFSNAGTTTLATGTLRGMNGATVRNSGTLRLNSEASNYGPTLYNAGGTTPQLINTTTGTIQKTAGTAATRSGFAVDLQGALDVATGQVEFPSSTVLLQGGSTVSGKVVLSGAAVTAGSVQARNATVELQSGTLTAATGTTPTIGTLNFSSGTLNGEGQLNVSNALSWTGGTMSGTGSTVVAPGATASLNAGGGLVTLDRRTLSNQGTATLVNGTLRGQNAATVLNGGTLQLNSEASNYGPTLYNAGGTTPKLINSLGGVVKKDAGIGVTGIGFATDNRGAIESRSGGELKVMPPANEPQPCIGGQWTAFPGGSVVSFTTGTFCFDPDTIWQGRIAIAGANLSAPSIDASQASVSMSGGSLTLTDGGQPSTIRDLTVSGGTLAGAAEVAVSDTLSWTGGSMSGTGRTRLGSGAVGTIAAGTGMATLDQRTFVNDGSTTLATGTLRGLNGSVIRNGGNLRLNSEASNYGPTLYAGGGATPRLLNVPGGTVRKAAGTGMTRVGFAIDNQGAVEAQTGDLAFGGGGIPDESGFPIGDPLLCPTYTNPQHGTWTAALGAGGIDLTSGCFTLGGGTIVAGVFNVQGAKVLVDQMQAPTGTVYASSGTLSFVTRSATSTIQSLYVAGTVTGRGHVDVCGSLTVQAGTLSGSGGLEICPGGTGSIAPPYGTSTVKRTVINNGTLTWSTGDLTLGDGAVLVNGGVLRVNSESAGGMSGGGSSMIENLGQIIKDGGLGTTRINAPVDNPGTIDSLSGTLTVQNQTCSSESNTGDDPEPTSNGPQPPPSAEPDYSDPTKAPGPDWEWRGKEPEGGDKGAWYNPTTGESWHPDLQHPQPIGPHWDYVRGGEKWRWDGGTYSKAMSACA